MKKALRVILIIVLVLIVGIGGLLAYVKFALPDVGAAPVMKVTATAEKVARGEYLANHVTVCIDCHSTRDWSTYSGPPIAGTFGMGGEAFTQKFGFPGEFYAKNITPAGIGTWTDGELYRAITSGVNKDGKALFPLMPHPAYGHMSTEDIESIIAYIRTLKPIENQVKPSVPDFPMSVIINTIPKKATPQPIPPKSDTLNYGRYLVNAASCKDCHTRMEKGAYVEGMTFAGNFEFNLPQGVVRSANITPDKQTGIGNWTKEYFLERFRSFSDPAKLPKVQPDQFNTVMPWTMYAGMTEEDLSAVFKYLQSVEPIENTVVKFTPAGGAASN
jgi:mono/diheme cytochrome c family protein